jgi:hypothetical protein
MKQITFRGLLRKIFTTLIIVVAAVTFQACYEETQIMVTGMVKSADNYAAIPGIKVSTYNYFCFTDSDGYFKLYIIDYGQIITFEDIDGTKYGEFHYKEFVTDEKDKGSIYVLMDRKE